MKITPYPHSQDSKVDFGAIVTDISLPSILSPTSSPTSPELLELEKALYENKVLIIKGQHDLTPVEQFELVCRFDPKAKREHGQGDPTKARAEFKGKKTLLEKPSIPPLPVQPEVRLLGHGKQPYPHWGLEEGVVLNQVSHTLWQKDPLSPEELAAGFTRWNRWHIDSSFYERSPPFITTLHAIQVPKGSDITVRWDDGTDLTMQVQAGATAFLSGAALLRSLNDEMRTLVENSEVSYAPHPFRWASASRGKSNGFGQHSEGREMPIEDLPEWDEEKVCRYPMVWTNPQTGEKSFQVHPIAAHKLHLKTAPDGEEKTISEISEVREWLYSLQHPQLRPENIFAPPYEEGDLVIFYNRGLYHAAVEYPGETHGARTMHQAHVPGSMHPR